MAGTHIFTSLVVPAVTNGPSLTALQWSDDGQAFIVTRGTVYILTPSTGIKFDSSGIVAASSAQSMNKNVKDEALSWYKNIIELERTLPHHWALESQEWGAISLGSLDVSWLSVTLSPTNLSRGAGCMMAALNTNLEVSLWAPSKNYLTGEWSKVQDLTQAIMECNAALPTAIRRTLNAQVQCISWSRQADLGHGRLYTYGSLLALGNRAGRVVLMQFSEGDVEKGLQPLASLEVADDWITNLIWSSWIEAGPGCSKASLACSVSDGSIVIASVTLFVENHAQWPGQPHLDISLVDEGRPCCPYDGNATTASTWINSKTHPPILVYAKSGTVFLQRMPSTLPLGWNGITRLTLQTQHVSSSSTSCSPVSGFLYYMQLDALLISLLDGSFHMIHSISTSPTLDTSVQGLRSEDLTNQVRTVFALAEGKVSFADANRTTGILDYDGAGSIGWLHEKCRPDDFSYKHDAKLSSMFIVTRLWTDENLILELLASELQNSTDLNAAPTHVLRGVFLHLRDKTFVETHQSRLLDILAQREALDESSAGGNILPTSRFNFRWAVAAALFRTREIRSCRMKLGVASFVSLVRGISASPFDKLVTELSTLILCFQLRAVLRQLHCIIDELEDSDRGFVHHWVLQCLAQESPRLHQEAASLANRVGIHIDSLPESPVVQEHCPACRTIMPRAFGGTATCPNGHVWTRCSVTSFILATPFVRTCVGCCRKALLPNSQRCPSERDNVGWLPPAADSRLVQDLLEAACWCTICGNRFVRVL